MIEDYLIKNSDIVIVSLYTWRYQFDSDKYSNEYRFESASIFFKRNSNIPGKRLNRKNRIHIKKENNLMDEIKLQMRYDMAIQFLKRLHFSPVISELNDIIDENGDPIIIIKEHWDTDVKSFEKCIDLSVTQPPQADNELQF